MTSAFLRLERPFLLFPRLERCAASDVSIRFREARRPPPDSSPICAKITPVHHILRRWNMISEEQVRHVANLARLGLSDEEVARMGGQLDAILESIEKIQELDLENVPPTANPLRLTNVFRPDEPRPELDRDDALSAAPETSDDLFSVPRID
jgi:aspartyl-tRNA(Asn)/glutamyl-tRNA(Gln) amidotransferase subunit C